MTPLRTGFALAIRVGLLHALCARVWALAPALSLGFMNSHVSWHELQLHGAASAVRMDGVADSDSRFEQLGLFCRCVLGVVAPSIDTLFTSRFGKVQPSGKAYQNPIFRIESGSHPQRQGITPWT